MLRRWLSNLLDALEAAFHGKEPIAILAAPRWWMLFQIQLTLAPFRAAVTAAARPERLQQ